MKPLLGNDLTEPRRLVLWHTLGLGALSSRPRLQAPEPRCLGEIAQDRYAIAQKRSIAESKRGSLRDSATRTAPLKS